MIFPHSETDVFSQVQTLRVAAVYNEDEIQFRYQFDTDSPSWYHRYLVYHNGEWVPAHSSSIEGAREPNLYEDRISLAIDDGSVPNYAYYGGYLVARPGTRSYPYEAPPEWVEDSPVGQRGYGDDVRKYIPESRTTQRTDAVWHSMRSEDEIEQLRRDGVFLNTWQWRAHRSNPIGYADHGYVLEYRNSSEGRGMYTDNWDDDNDRPMLMYDLDRFGFAALSWDRLRRSDYTQDDPYFLYDGHAVPFDPDRAWRQGDVLPAVYLRDPEGSRGSITADGHYHDGAWNVRVTRTREAPNPLDGKSLHEGETYNIQFAVHTAGTGERYHLVSMPLTFSLDGQGDLVATRVDGDLDNASVGYTELPIFYPGILTLEELRGDNRAARRYRDASEAPLDRQRVEAFLNEVLRHERWRMSQHSR